MKAKEVVRKLKQLGCTKLRQKGSHAFYVCSCGQHKTVVPMHAGEDVAVGTVLAIERSMAPCLGKGWLK